MDYIIKEYTTSFYFERYHMKNAFLFSSILPITLVIFISIFFIPLTYSNDLTSFEIPVKIYGDNPKEEGVVTFRYEDGQYEAIGKSKGNIFFASEIKSVISRLTTIY